MKFFSKIGKAVGEAAEFVAEKNRRTAYLNRIRTVIRCEEKAAEREYVALGRYYYNNLRDKDNGVTEAHCAQLDAIGERLDKALNQLEQFYSREAEEPVVEEITLEDVKEFDEEPEIAEEPKEAACPCSSVCGEEASPIPADPAEPDKNDGLPFEG